MYERIGNRFIKDAPVETKHLRKSKQTVAKFSIGKGPEEFTKDDLKKILTSKKGMEKGRGVIVVGDKPDQWTLAELKAISEEL